MMGRRTANGKALFKLAVQLPWFVSLATAAALWAGFDYLSYRWGAPMFGTASPPGTAPGFVLLGTVSRILRYVLPLVFVAGSLAGLVRGGRRGRLFAVATKDPTQLRSGMSWREFERVVADAFTRSGYEVRERGGAQADGGVDIVLYRDGRRYLVQCKQWRSKKVHVATVRELLGVVSASGADGGFVVSAGEFTRSAVALAAGRPVVLIDNDRLVQMMRTPLVAAASIDWESTMPRATSSRVGAPTCPQCDSRMVKRVAKTGRGAGEPFWGCPRYPGCRGTRGIV
jgi:restriction system protein